MKQIENPNNWQLGILLLPVVFVCIMVIVQRTFAPWAKITMLASFVLYLAALTYFCLRQKCYGQLITNYVVVIMWAIIFIIQFYLI